MFVQSWRNSIITALRDGSFNPSGRRYPSVADNILLSFPRLDIVHAFLSPIVSAPESLNKIALAIHPPNLCSLARLCERYFSWGTSSQLINQFEKYVWTPVVTRTLMAEAIESSSTLGAHLPVEYQTL